MRLVAVIPATSFSPCEILLLIVTIVISQPLAFRQTILFTEPIYRKILLTWKIRHIQSIYPQCLSCKFRITWSQSKVYRNLLSGLEKCKVIVLFCLFRSIKIRCLTLCSDLQKSVIVPVRERTLRNNHSGKISFCILEWSNPFEIGSAHFGFTGKEIEIALCQAPDFNLWRSHTAREKNPDSVKSMPEIHISFVYT